MEYLLADGNGVEIPLKETLAPTRTISTTATPSPELVASSSAYNKGDWTWAWWVGGVLIVVVVLYFLYRVFSK